MRMLDSDTSIIATERMASRHGDQPGKTQNNRTASLIFREDNLKIDWISAVFSIHGRRPSNCINIKIRIILGTGQQLGSYTIYCGDWKCIRIISRERIRLLRQ